MILLSVGPGQGALRSPEIVGELVSAGHGVEVVLERGAEHFIGPAAFAPLAPVVREATGPAETTVFAPATAATLARLARGPFEGPAEQAYAAGRVPAVVAPELDEATWKYPAVCENVALLQAGGCRVLEGSGENMVPPLAIAGATLNSLGGPLSGMRMLITAGGTHEPIDKVRFVGNRSSGKMGTAIAREAYRRGAEVMTVAANVEEKEPGTKWVDVETYAEAEEATMRLAAHADALIMAAAISDFTPAEVNEGKIRRGSTEELELKLVATGDILRAVRKSNPELFMVGFAATFGDPAPDAREKLGSKGIDLVVGNDISHEGSGFGSEENEVYIVGRQGEQFVPRTSKTEVAREILEAVASEMLGKER